MLSPPYDGDQLPLYTNGHGTSSGRYGENLTVGENVTECPSLSNVYGALSSEEIGSMGEAE